MNTTQGIPGDRPLSRTSFDILLALADEDRHGYSILRELREQAAGNRTLNPGTLYRNLARLLDQGLVQELNRRPAGEADDERRRYYRLTRLGRRVAADEARRLANRVQLAQKRRLLES